MAGKKNVEKVTTKKATAKKTTTKKVAEKKIDLDSKEQLTRLRNELKKEIDESNIKPVKDKKTTKKVVKDSKPFDNRKPLIKNETLKKALKAFSMVVMSVLLAICAFLITYIAVNKISQLKGKTPPLGLYTIISPSMTPKIKVYDVVFVVKTEPEKIKIGDVISYYSTNDYFKGVPITHRVVEKLNTNEGIVFITQGDANPSADSELILSNNVVGVVRARVPQLGRIQFFLSSKMGWIIAILIPALGVLSYDILKLFNLIKLKNELLKTKKAIK